MSLSRSLSRSSRSLASLLTLTSLALVAGCTLGTPGADASDPSATAEPAPTEGGAVAANDRTDTAKSGEKLLTGDMIVSPAGGYAVLQRNSVSIVVDAAQGTARELPFQVDRFVFASGFATGYAINPANAVVAFDLATLQVLWSTSLPTSDVALFRVAPDDRALVVALGDRVVALDTATGLVRGSVNVTSRPTYLAFAGSSRAIVVGSTRWTDHHPATSLTSIDLAGSAAPATAPSIDVPNCEAPLTMLPDGTRGFLSPTYCEETVPANVQKTWTNPDPVSVVDNGAAGLSFVKNLPGFGPVALNGRADHSPVCGEVSARPFRVAGVHDDWTLESTRASRAIDVVVLDDVARVVEPDTTRLQSGRRGRVDAVDYVVGLRLAVPPVPDNRAARAAE